MLDLTSIIQPLAIQSNSILADYSQPLLHFYYKILFNLGHFVHLLFNYLFNFVFYYPLVMAYIWMIGALIYFSRWERKGHKLKSTELDIYPPISFIVPCHNEGRDVEETIEYLLKQDYPDFEVIAVNDGSTDNTLSELMKLAEIHPRLRVIDFPVNQGKALALTTGALASRNEFLICIDGDALLDSQAGKFIMRHFLESPRVGAVTGNPRIRTRSSLLGKIQVGEFSAIIGLIKRAQRVYGRIFTVSGVISGFRKSAVHQVGYWSVDMVTDDIDISWKLQLANWEIRYEENALCWILMPETLRGLWRQRLRWAQGGIEVLLRYTKQMLHWRSRRMFPIYLDYIASILWSYTIFALSLLSIVSIFIPLPEHYNVFTMLPGWSGLLLAGTCLMQFMISLIIDSRYEKGSARTYYWIVWYPFFYWFINVITIIAGTVKVTMKKPKARAVWTSPDRGIR